MLLQQLVTDISIGSVCALLAVGCVLVFSVLNFSNFGFEPVTVLGAFVAFYAIPALNLPSFPSISLAMAVADIVPFIIELMVYRPMRQRKTLELYLMTVGPGINTFVPNAAVQIFGGGVHASPSNWARVAVQIGSVAVPRSDILATALSILTLVRLWMFPYDARMGLGIRTSSFSTGTASLMSINVNLVAMIVFLLFDATVDLADCFYGVKCSVFPSTGAIANKGFVAAAIGDLGNLTGAVISGLLLGFLETMIAGYVPSTYHDLIVYATLVIVLVLMPSGVLGKGMYDEIQGVKTQGIQKALPLVHVLILYVSAV